MSQDILRKLFPPATGITEVVPRDRLTAYERWELPVIEQRMQQAADQIARGPQSDGVEPLPTAGDLQALHDRAYNEGWQAGLEEGRAAVKSRVDLLSRAIQQAGDLLRDNEDALARRVLNLVVAMTREVVLAELKLQPEALLVVVREALAVLPSGTQAPDVRLHPDDLAWMREHPDVDPAWQLIADPGVGRGSCRVEMGDSLAESDLVDRWSKVLASIGRADPWQDASDRAS